METHFLSTQTLNMLIDSRSCNNPIELDKNLTDGKIAMQYFGTFLFGKKNEIEKKTYF